VVDPIGARGDVGLANDKETAVANDSSNSSISVTIPSTEPAAALLHYWEAYQRVLAAQPELDPPQFLVVNIDVVSACTTVIGALTRIAAYHDRASELTEFDIKNFDNLETYALALMHAQRQYVSASAPPEALIALNEEGVTLREMLYMDAAALATRSLIDGEALKNFKTGPGYKNLAEDLVGLCSLLRRAWDKIGTRTVITMAELHQAEHVSERLLRAVAARANASDVLAEAIQKRLQMFTLMVNAYDQVRRAILFLRWRERDLQAIAPSLYAGRGRKKRGPEQPQLAPSAPDGTALTAIPGSAEPIERSGTANEESQPRKAIRPEELLNPPHHQVSRV